MARSVIRRGAGSKGKAKSGSKRGANRPPEHLGEPHDPKQLPPLLVAIYKDAEFLRVVALDDPRKRFCECYNEQSAEFGHTALPIGDDEITTFRALAAKCDQAAELLKEFAGAGKGGDS